MAKLNRMATVIQARVCWINIVMYSLPYIASLITNSLHGKSHPLELRYCIKIHFGVVSLLEKVRKR